MILLPDDCQFLIFIALDIFNVLNLQPLEAFEPVTP